MKATLIGLACLFICLPAMAQPNGGEGDDAVRCARSLKDIGNPGCIRASSTPRMGALYPLSEDFFVDSAGYVGVGTTAPSHPFHVAGDAKVDGTMQFSNSEAPMMYMFEDGVINPLRAVVAHSPGFPDWGLFYQDELDTFFFKSPLGDALSVNLVTGRVGVLNPDPIRLLNVGTNTGDSLGIGSVEYFEDGGSFELLCDSDITSAIDGVNDLGNPSFCWDDVFAHSYVVCSDENAKTGIQDTSYGLNEILQLRPVTYRYKAKQDEGLQIGLLAQEVLPVMPEVVKTENVERDEETGQRRLVKTDRLGINYTALIPVLINALHEQQAVIERQEQVLNNLERRLLAVERP